MRMLDRAKIPYTQHSYDVSDGLIDGVSVAHKTGQNPDQVFKTLVTSSGSQLYVFVVPVAKELDLKKAAREAGEKRVEMIHVKDILKFTGYIRGGCSPIGMKKLYPTLIDQSAQMFDTILVSGGQKGLQIEVSPLDLAQLIDAKFAELTVE
ncbi:Cys-tRNA(Pro)/Cys-tRNA(Cys) deacylase [Solibaculum mannosilyticum]|uniref:Cys-tRNA(Pro)/Cys-tRNA(Cys) deacylase n=2 Tax=Solibaculum mannosilyticum TaxID=2780922 RepID=A0A7I8D2Q9_9FIRM|nr:Cys-tRNA(Pro)/Cys-tRNA(Cys) deacylase [Solibaculum mannosilyticum]